MARYLYSELSTLLQARANCLTKQMFTPLEKHTDMIESLVKNHMPSGSGFDCGTKLDLDASHAEKLVFTTEFHHMNDGGYYDGWTEHTITVTPSLSDGFRLRISGRNCNEIKDLIHEQFRHALQTDVEWDIVQTWPTAKDVSIKSRWISDENGCNSTMVYDVMKGDTVVDTIADGYDRIERARVLAVRTVKGY